MQNLKVQAYDLFHCEFLTKCFLLPVIFFKFAKKTLCIRSTSEKNIVYIVYLRYNKHVFITEQGNYIETAHASA